MKIELDLRDVYDLLREIGDRHGTRGIAVARSQLINLVKKDISQILGRAFTCCHVFPTV